MRNTAHRSPTLSNVIYASNPSLCIPWIGSQFEVRKKLNQHDRILELWRLYRGDVITQAAFFKHLKEEKKQFKLFKKAFEPTNKAEVNISIS